jgi:predicted transcriptional regulator of viral defense system
MKTLSSVADILNNLQAQGRYSFPKKEISRRVNESANATQLALWRLAKKKRVAQIRNGFFIIVPPEYSAKGILPTEWFINDLMKYLKTPYYVGLLSAAATHGAAHQQPQEFHVITPYYLRCIKIKGLNIRFFVKSSIKKSYIIDVKTSTGFMKVSNPAVTALDLVAYSKQVGGLDRVALLLEELSEKINPKDLVKTAKTEPQISNIQRLGWLLDTVGKNAVADPLAEWLKKKKPREIPLEPSLRRKGASSKNRWRVIANTTVEI